MTTGFEIHDDGTSAEVELTRDTLESSKAYCIIDDESSCIYLWKGRKTGVRKKFIGAQVASSLRSQFGSHYKVRPLDEGDEPPSFFNVIQ